MTSSPLDVGSDADGFSQATIAEPLLYAGCSFMNGCAGFFGQEI